MIFALQNYLMFNLLAIAGYLISSWWAWFWTCDLIHPGYGVFLIIMALAVQYKIVFWIFILLLIEILIRSLFDKLDDILNFGLSANALKLGLILLIAPLLYFGLLFIPAYSYIDIKEFIFS